MTTLNDWADMASVGNVIASGGRRLYQLRKGIIATGERDSYKVIGCLGSGGFGAVYTVRRVSDGLVAVLKMSTDVKKNEFGGDRIRREAWVMRRCGRKNPDLVPRILDSGDVSGRPFFVMENLHRLGWSSDIADNLGLPDKEESRIFFFSRLIESIAAVHAAGFVHCDIKPENIMQRPDTHRPILIDFGSAHPIESDELFPRTSRRNWIELTRKCGKMAFTPGYDAPEDAFTIQKDIFAVGQVIRDSFGEDVPFEWMEIIGRCISRNPSFRYGSLAALAKDISLVERRRRQRYWKMRKAQIAAQREVERSLSEADLVSISRDRILRLDERLSNADRTVFKVEFPANERLHYVVTEPICLRENTILMISGKGMLEAEISGPDSSVVVLRDYAVLHNTSDTLPPENALMYVIVGPGSYLNFTDLGSDQYREFFPDSHRRILRDIDATTSFRFGGPETFSGIESETLDAIKGSRLPESYKETLLDFFSGKKFTVQPK